MLDLLWLSALKRRERERKKTHLSIYALTRTKHNMGIPFFSYFIFIGHTARNTMVALTIYSFFFSCVSHTNILFFILSFTHSFILPIFISILHSHVHIAPCSMMECKTQNDWIWTMSFKPKACVCVYVSERERDRSE